MAASAEFKSEHPLGRAVVSYARDTGVPLSETSSFEKKSGKEIVAEVGAQRLLCGNEKFLEESGIRPDKAAASALRELRAQGKASVLAADNQRCLGIKALSDVVRREAPDMVSDPAAPGPDTVLLTGDHTTAEYFAARSAPPTCRRISCPRRKWPASAGFRMRSTRSA